MYIDPQITRNQILAKKFRVNLSEWLEIWGYWKEIQKNEGNWKQG